MEQKTTLSQSIDITEQKAQYDAACKKVLAEKIILAWIMKHTVKEYADCDVREIAEHYIVEEPEVAKAKVMPDETTAPKISGTGVEDITVTEGSVKYDIQFRAIVPSLDEVVQMIINVEAQNNFYPGYPIIKRGIYYCARMISSQYGTVFTNSHYEKIQKVYSVWICMNPPKERYHTITGYSLTEMQYVGKVKEKAEYYDLMTAIMVCLGSNEEDAEHELLRLLGVLLSSDKKAKEKKDILENEFHIPMTEKLEEEVEFMCNLSDGVEERGIQKGILKGVEENRHNTVVHMIQENLSIEVICRVAECDLSYVEKIQEELAVSE